jgi:hypothetical protein
MQSIGAFTSGGAADLSVGIPQPRNTNHIGMTKPSSAWVHPARLLPAPYPKYQTQPLPDARRSAMAVILIQRCDKTRPSAVMKNSQIFPLRPYPPWPRPSMMVFAACRSRPCATQRVGPVNFNIVYEVADENPTIHNQYHPTYTPQPSLAFITIR